MKGSASYQKDMLLPTRHSSKCGVKEGSSTVLGVCSEQNHCLFYIFTAPGSSLVLPFEAPATLCFIEVKMCQTEAVTYETLPWFMADCCRAGMQMDICFATSARLHWCLDSRDHRWSSSISWIYFCSSKWRIWQPKGHDLLQNWLQQCSTSVELVWKLNSQSGDNYQQLSFLPSC